MNYHSHYPKNGENQVQFLLWTHSLGLRVMNGRIQVWLLVIHGDYIFINIGYIRLYTLFDIGSKS